MTYMCETQKEIHCPVHLTNTCPYVVGGRDGREGVSEGCGGMGRDGSEWGGTGGAGEDEIGEQKEWIQSIFGISRMWEQIELQMEGLIM